MRTIGNGSLAAMAAALIATGCASAPDPGNAIPHGKLELSATGAGNWDVECTATTNRGTAKSDLQGRGATSTDTLLIREVRRASCTYEIGDAPVTLKLMEKGLACPFGGFETGLCQTVLSANASGTFEFSPE